MFVKKGDLLVSFDTEIIRKEGLNPVISVILLDQKDKQIDLFLYPIKEAKANESLALKAVIY